MRNDVESYLAIVALLDDIIYHALFGNRPSHSSHHLDLGIFSIRIQYHEKGAIVNRKSVFLQALINCKVVLTVDEPSSAKFWRGMFDERC